jgi:NADH-quinone oxidoreductase subunit M
VAATGVILAALYLLWAYQRVFHGAPEPAENAEIPDLNLREGLAIAPLVGLIVFLGVYPKPMLERIEPSVNALLQHVGEVVPGFAEEQGPSVSPATVEDLGKVSAGSATGGGGHQ